MKRIVLLIIYFLIVVLIAALDSAFFPALGGFWLYMNVSLAIGLFLVVILNRRIALIVYLSSTVLIAFAASQMILLPLLLGASILLFVDWLVETVFTNRSYYTLIALGLLGWIVYYLFYALFIIIIGLFSTSFLHPEITFSWVFSIILNAILIYFFFSIAYIVTHYMSKRFKSYFILSEQ